LESFRHCLFVGFLSVSVVSHSFEGEKVPTTDLARYGFAMMPGLVAASDSG